MKSLSPLLLCSFATLAGLQAAILSPSSYDLLNGEGVASSGTFNYWDLSYTGSGSTNVDNSPLTGGLGDLTNGIIAVQNWNLVENGAGTGPYVGWRAAVNPAPLVTFRFAAPVLLNSLTIHVDDSNGLGGVSPPLSVDIGLEGGPFTNFLTADPASSTPTSYTFPNLALSGSAVSVRFNYANEWIFVSEVTFDGDAAGVPEPASFAMALGGLSLAAIAYSRRR